MKMKTRIVIAFVFVAALPLFANQLTVTKYDFVAVKQGSNSNGKTQTMLSVTRYIAPDGRALTDSPDPEMKHHIVDVTTPDGTHSILDMNKKKFFTLTDAQLESSPQSKKGTPLGTKTIQGLVCHGFGGDSSDGAYMEHWWCIDAASGKDFVGDFLMRDPVFGVEYHESLQKVTTGVEVPEVFFDVPSDFQYDGASSPIKP
jgi:hypothetical protein